MESRSHAFLAGLFVLTLGAAVVVAAIWMGQQSRSPQLPYVMVSYTSVRGLTVQAPVRYRGVDVGRVESVGLDPTDPARILIGVEIDAKTPMSNGTFGRLTFQGVTGIPFIEIDDSGQPGSRLETSWETPAQLELRPSTLEEFGDAGQLLLVRVNQIARRLNDLMNEENMARLSGTLAGLETATQRLVTLQDGLQPAVARMPELMEAATDTMSEVRDLSREVASLTVDLQSKSEAIEQVGSGVERLGRAATDVSTQTLPRLNRVLVRLERTTESLERVLDAQARDPRGLLFGVAPPEPGPGEPGFDDPTGGEQ